MTKTWAIAAAFVGVGIFAEGGEGPSVQDLVRVLRPHLVSKGAALEGRIVWLRIGGAGPQQVRLKAVANEGLRVEREGIAFDVAWERLDPESIHRLAAHVVADAPTEMLEAYCLLYIQLGRSSEQGFAESLAALRRRDAAAAERVEQAEALSRRPKQQAPAAVQAPEAPRTRGLNIVFPPKAKVFDVTKPPYNADNTGRQDVTAILNRAIADTQKLDDHWAIAIVYLPEGTYLVSDTISFKFPPGTVGPHVVGQSRKGTVIRLADGTWPTGKEIKPVIKTGRGVAQCFHRGLSNLTVNIGKNNAGAIGVYWYGNNLALMSDVDIISEDGKGFVGLYTGHWQKYTADGGEQGPCGVRNVFVRGFDKGVTANALNSITFTGLVLEGQNQVGIENEHHPIYIEQLISRNVVPAIRSDGGHIVLVDSELSGGAGDQTAIEKRGGGSLFVRNVAISGYGRGIVDGGGPGHPSGLVAEYAHPKPVSLFGTPGKSLNLPVKLPPEPEWETDFSRWATIEEYKTGGRTDAQALQAAIDDPKNTTIVMPSGSAYKIDETVLVRGSIRRIIGTGAMIDGKGELVIVDGGCPVVKLEKLSTGHMDQPHPRIVQRSSRTVVLESVMLSWGEEPIVVDGPGEVFITDTVNHLHVKHPNARVWAWHFDAEGTNRNLVVEGGTVRIFGWKDEGVGQPLICRGGITEVLGFHEYSGAPDKGTDAIATVTGDNTKLSIACLSQINWTGTHYRVLLRETRGNVTRELKEGTSGALIVAYPVGQQ